MLSSKSTPPETMPGSDAQLRLGQIVRHGRRLLGSDGAYGNLISRHLFEQADFTEFAKVVAMNLDK